MSNQCKLTSQTGIHVGVLIGMHIIFSDEFLGFIEGIGQDDFMFLMGDHVEISGPNTRKISTIIIYEQAKMRTKK